MLDGFEGFRKVFLSPILTYSFANELFMMDIDVTGCKGLFPDRENRFDSARADLKGRIVHECFRLGLKMEETANLIDYGQTLYDPLLEISSRARRMRDEMLSEHNVDISRFHAPMLFVNQLSHMPHVLSLAGMATEALAPYPG